ncbi:AraC family transcriptional regulator [Paenibacillus physcomitrellae]|uniref:HTH araC/xylS-type domain-containing protein n=1 Tax=Paenibacillus physcomitrellae TaxID=1619311 RepID=A0ABQ1GRH5_9BACL|nr:AraC family transcriptional regulator [Paenibacillus physcomitrellae]GGA48978.1 hypothetical protein GCM10010917_37840 [Paenibacillus physcomitrellae]
MNKNMMIAKLSGRRWWPKGAWNAFFWSYMALLVLLIIIGSLLYWRAKAVVEQSVDHTNVALLGQLRVLADGQLEKVRQLEQQVMTLPELQLLLGENGPISAQQNLNMITLTNEFKRYLSMSPLVYDYYVYFPQTQTMLGPGVRTSADILFGDVYRFENRSASDWMAFFSQQNMSWQFLPETSVTNNFGEQRWIVPYTRYMPAAGGYGQKAALLILINGSELRSLFQDLVTDGPGNIYILDSSNRIISSTDERQNPLPVRYAEMAEDHGKLEMKWKGEETVFSYATSRVYGWKYVVEVPRDIFLQEVRQVKNLAIVLLLVAALAGAGVSLYLAYRNYLPLRNLVRTVTEKKQPVGRERELNEYELIQSIVETSRLTESELQTRLLRQAPIIRVHFLSRLIRGYAEPHELRQESLQFMGLRFLSSNYAVILMEVEDMSGFAKDEQEWTFVSFIISNIAEDLANERHVGYATELDQGRIALLLNFSGEQAAELEQERDRIADQLQQVLQQRFRLQVSAGKSFIADSMQRIGEAFRDALKRRGAEREPDAGPCREAAAVPVYHYPLEIEQQLTNFVKSGDTEKTKQLLEALYKDHKESSPGSEASASYFLLQAASTLFRIVQYTPRVDPQLGAKLFSQVREQPGDAEQAFIELKANFIGVCRLWREGRTDQTYRTLEAVKRIVRERYGQNGLSVGLIADELGLTQSYLSSFFKKAAGQTLMEFIASVRLEEAKRLLACSGCTIGQIAKEVGYTNDIGFIRFFKKYEGITPGQFRENLHTEHRS